MKINIQLLRYGVWNDTLCFLDFRRALESKGVLVTEECPDVSLIDWRIREAVKGFETSGPTIIFNAMDTSAVMASCVEMWDDDPNVIGYMIPIKSHGESMCRYVWGQGETKLPVRALTAMLWGYCRRDQTFDCPQDKKWDVWFAGTVGNGHDWVRDHRERMVAAWPQLDGLKRNMYVGHANPLPWNTRQAYWMSTKAKVVVSPWGVCEISWRDYEAVLGCSVMVKPRQPQFDVTANPWGEENVVYCEPDFSDLREAVDEALGRYDFDKLFEHRAHLLHRSDWGTLANEFISVIESFQ